MTTKAEVEGTNKRLKVKIVKIEFRCGFWQTTRLPYIYIYAVFFIGTKQYRTWYACVSEYYCV